MEELVAWAKEYETLFAVGANIFVIFGITAVIITWRSMMTNSAASLSSRMFEINRLEIEKPHYFIALGDGNSLVPVSSEQAFKSEDESIRFHFEEKIRLWKSLKKRGDLPSDFKERAQSEMAGLFFKAARCSCLCNCRGRAEEETIRELSHYLFILFSFYEQVFIIHRCYLGCYRSPWQKRFVEHMEKRPLFRMYWYTVYRNQCTPKFRRIVRKLEAGECRWLRARGGIESGQVGAAIKLNPASCQDRHAELKS
jgi:hypothetical protein